MKIADPKYCLNANPVRLAPPPGLPRWFTGFRTRDSKDRAQRGLAGFLECMVARVSSFFLFPAF